MDNTITKRVTNKLSDRSIRAFIARHRGGRELPNAKLGDGGGMFLAVSAAGKAAWRIKYRFSGQEQDITIGSYPSLTLEAARAERERIKALLREGRDPIQDRALNRTESITASGNTFAALAKDWLDKKCLDWRPIHYTKSNRAMERDVLPLLGKLAVRDITPGMVAGVIEGIAKRGARDTAAKAT